CGQQIAKWAIYQDLFHGISEGLRVPRRNHESGLAVDYDIGNVPHVSGDNRPRTAQCHRTHATLGCVGIRQDHAHCTPKQARHLRRCNVTIDQFDPRSGGNSLPMKLEITAGSGHDHPKSMPTTVQNIAGVQEIAQALVSQDAAKEQKGTRLVRRNILVDIRATEYAMRYHVDSALDAGIEFLELRAHARAMND